jgi:hypothetical protein
MQLTDDFIDTMEEFYDKTISKYTFTREKTDGGFVKRAITESEDSIMANVLSNHGKIQKDYGITDAFDLAFTCKPDEEIEADDIVGYDSKTYKVTGVKTSDSHKLVIAITWSSKSSTLISA